MNLLNRIFAKTAKIAVLASVAVLFGACSGGDDIYSPWPSLSRYFNTDKITISNNTGYFNTSELCAGKELYVRKPFSDGEYTATVLGMNVVLRSRPAITPTTKRGNVQTGDFVRVLGPAEYNMSNNKYWNYVEVLSGRCQGFTGYICNDFLISQEKYNAFQDYVFGSWKGGSNISYRHTESKYLNAISDVLLKFDVSSRSPQLTIRLLDAKRFGAKMVTTFQIHDLNMGENDTMLAFIEFTQGTNEFTVLGVVPGKYQTSIIPMGYGSYNIQYVL